MNVACRLVLAAGRSCSPPPQRWQPGRRPVTIIVPSGAGGGTVPLDVFLPLSSRSALVSLSTW